MKRIKTLTINGSAYQLMDGEAARIDDAAAGANAWSGKNIVDRLCPGFTERGSVVTCQPVEGYPLKVVTRIDPVQSGTGDPSPENVRPIAGHTAVNLRHTGKNLLDINDTLTFTQWIQLNFHLPAGTYTVSHNGYEQGAGATKAPCFIFPGFDQTAEQRFLLSEGKSKTITIKGPATGVGIYTNGYAYAGSEGVECSIYDLQITPVGADIGYEPYRGTEISADLGQVVYGGSYDWGTGLLEINRDIVTIDGTTLKFADTNGFWNLPRGCAPGVKHGVANTVNSHFPYNKISANGPNEFLYITATAAAATGLDTVEALNAFCAEQYAAGTPVQSCYELAQPYTVQLTPQEIHALSGENVLYSDTGDTTVTGRADPKTVIEKLTNAILALGGNV